MNFQVAVGREPIPLGLVVDGGSFHRHPVGIMFGIMALPIVQAGRYPGRSRFGFSILETPDRPCASTDSTTPQKIPTAMASKSDLSYRR